MAKDWIRYDLLVQQALRGVVRSTLERVAREGLPGNHHFFITFRTQDEGVEVSQALQDAYPDEMTIVLQHQYWGLSVSEDGFTVGLSFNKVPETLVIPFSAVSMFHDPSVQFVLPFQAVSEEAPGAKPPEAGVVPSIENTSEDTPPSDEKSGAEPKPGEKGEVVSLDKFRKK